ncbi:hypothetical protein BC940DRAFT_337256 [Gongronella butleri]|nr:hypothetical protein BC940DRAFT_337256 [Gongronella butleri]
MESALPTELLKLVFLQLPRHDLFEVRFVCRRWSLVISEIVFQFSFLPLSNHERVREMIDHCKITTNATLPVKRVHVYLMRDNRMDTKLELLAEIAPYLNNVHTATFNLCLEEVSLNDQHWASIMQIVRFSHLRELSIHQNTRDSLENLSVSVHAIVSSMSTALRKIDLSLLTSDMDLGVIFALVDRAPQLENIQLMFSRDNVDDQPLRNFLASPPKVYRAQCFHVAQLFLSMRGDSGTPDPAGLLAFACFYLPRLKWLCITIGASELLPPTHSLDHHFPPLPQLHLNFPEYLTLDLANHHPSAAEFDPLLPLRSTTRLFKVLRVCAKALVVPEVLSSLNCSRATTIIVRQTDSDAPLLLTPSLTPELTMLKLRKSLLPQFDLQLRNICSSPAQLATLDLEECTLGDFGVLERALAQLPGLQVLALQLMRFTRWTFVPPSVSIDNPWIPVLRSLFVQLNDQPDASMQWITLPLPLTRICITEHMPYPDPTRVYIFLQNMSQSYGPHVEIWLHGFMEGRSYELPLEYDEDDDDNGSALRLPEEESQVPDDELQDLLVHLTTCNGQLDAGMPMHLPHSPSTLAEIALLCLCKYKNASVYTCPAAHRWIFTTHVEGMDIIRDYD